MPRLLLKFDTAVLKEVPVGPDPIRIGRAVDNDIHIDNLAVSEHHACIYMKDAALVVEDLNSLNGTFVNDRRIKREALHSGDSIAVGKHRIMVDADHNVTGPFDPGRKITAPKLDETVVLDSKLQPELAKGDSNRGPLPNLLVIKGRVRQRVYVLSSNLTIIGKSPMATVRLKGWFAPEVAAQITKRQDGYYVGLTKRAAKVNGLRILAPTRLNDGDLIEVGGVVVKFVHHE